jgi:prepilin-type N-terminal cleavage/methylation domain-containing protein
LSSFWKNKAEGKHGGQEQRAKGRNGKMTGLNRKGFTLVELLVVVVIIAMLVGLTVPAVQSSREKARQAQCTNNQHEIALAVLQYETAKKSFPGYVNKFGTGQTSNTDPNPRLPLSWATVILPYLDNEKVWQEWRGLRNVTTISTTLQIKLPQYICPSNSFKQSEKSPLSYAANCGRRDVPVASSSGSGNWDPDKPWDSADNGVFQNRYACDRPAVTSSSLRDGAAQTIMFTENIQAGTWFASPDISTKEKLAENEAYLGVLWWLTAPNDCVQINACRDNFESAPSSVDWSYARPSSNHPGGILVTYCDGHQQFVSERIQYETYQHLMTPNSTGAGLSTQLTDPELQVGQ